MKRFELMRFLWTYMTVTTVAISMVACAGYKAPVVDAKTGNFTMPKPSGDPAVDADLAHKDDVVITIRDASAILEMVKKSSPEEAATVVNENPLVAMIGLSVKVQEANEESQTQAKREIVGTLTILNSEGKKLELRSLPSPLGVVTTEDTNPGLTVLLDFKSETIGLITVILTGEATLGEDGTAHFTGNVLLSKEESSDSLMGGGFEETVKAEDTVKTEDESVKETELGKFQVPLCKLSASTYKIGETTVNCAEKN